jgi:hypothetical protein
MIRNSDKVQRTLKAEFATGVSGAVVGRKEYRFATRKGISLGRAGTKLAGIGVEGQRGVNVEITPINLSQRVVFRTCRSRLVALDDVRLVVGTGCCTDKY